MKRSVCPKGRARFLLQRLYKQSFFDGMYGPSGWLSTEMTFLKIVQSWNEVNFIDRDWHYYASRRRVKEAIHVRFHPNNINRDHRIEIPKARTPTIRKHDRWGDGYRSEPPRKPLLMAPLRKQPLIRKMRINCDKTNYQPWKHFWEWKRSDLLTFTFKTGKSIFVGQVQGERNRRQIS